VNSFRIVRCPTEPIAIATLVGLVDYREMLVRVDRAYRDGVIEPGMARLVILSGDPGGDGSAEDIGGLVRNASELDEIGAIVRKWETSDAHRPAFRAVHLALTDPMAIMADIYFAMWQFADPVVSTEFTLVRSFAQADAALSGTVSAAFRSAAYRPEG